ncbi:MAG: hypothetical protein ACFFCV_21160, partial [Promethearchaeota archaeon]
MKSKLFQKTNSSTEKGLSLYTFAKYANRELLLESLLQSKGTYQTLFLERFKKNQRTFKIKVIATKILYSIIFGILPILLIATYLEIIETLRTLPYAAENIILTGIIFFGLYFILQFFNFFLMGIMESSMVMSGLIYSWFETLPISKQRLRRLTYLTIFRTFDIPIVIIVLGFPITLLIQTQNFLIFLICLSISVINLIFSFDLLIIFGKRLQNVLYSSPKKALRIRLLNILSYIAVILGSIYIIEWVFSSIHDIFNTLLFYQYASLTNIILSTIPYPFNPSYLLTLVVTPSEISMYLWISTFVGLSLFLLITYFIHVKTSKILAKISSTNPINIQHSILIEEKEKKETQIKVKINRTIIAFIRKDLAAASHDIKIAVSLIMPIILSCIFTFSFNSANLNAPIVIERDIIVYCLGLLIFFPIISGMLVYAITSIDISGETILAALPIIPRDRAKAKLIIMLILQTATLFAPLFLFVLSPKFSSFLLASLIMMPFVWIFITITFELKIFYFNKFRNRYVIGEIITEKRMFKWAVIISIQYIIIFWMLSFILIFFKNEQIQPIVIFYCFTTLVIIVVGVWVFNKMFPNILKDKIEYIYLESIPTRFSRHTWLSIGLLIILYYINLLLSGFFLQFLFNISVPMRDYYFGYYAIMILCGDVLFNLSFVPLFLIIIPRGLGLPNGKQSIKNYIKSIKMGWLKNSIKILLWVVVGILAIFVSHTILAMISSYYTYIPEGFIAVNDLFLYFIDYLGLYFWREFLLRGIILTMLLRTCKNKKAIILNAIIGISVGLFPGGFYFPYEFYNAVVLYFVFCFTSVFIIQLILAFLFVKTN